MSCVDTGGFRALSVSFYLKVSESIAITLHDVIVVMNLLTKFLGLGFSTKDV